MGQLKPWVERLPLYVETVKKPMDAMVQGMAAEGVQFAKDIAGAPKVFTSADAARDIRGILSLAWEDIKVGRFHLAGHKIESIGILIREITDSPARATMGLLDVAVNEALADLTRLTGWLDMARAYYSRTLAAALMNGTGNGGELIGRGFEVGLLKDVDGKVLASKETGQLIEDFWREVLPEDGLFRDALTALDGGTITAEELKRPAVDVSAPELGSAARAEARTEKLLRTRREMLEAARKLRESTKKARDR
jgi:hypothetical protein